MVPPALLQKRVLRPRKSRNLLEEKSNEGPARRIKRGARRSRASVAGHRKAHKKTRLSEGNRIGRIRAGERGGTKKSQGKFCQGGKMKKINAGQGISALTENIESRKVGGRRKITF